MLHAVLADFIIDNANERHEKNHADETAAENSVLDAETGQMMECRHLVSHRNPKIRATWSESAANELGSLF